MTIVNTLLCILLSVSFEVYSKSWIVYSPTSIRIYVLFDERFIMVSFTIWDRSRITTKISAQNLKFKAKNYTCYSLKWYVIGLIIVKTLVCILKSVSFEIIGHRYYIHLDLLEFTNSLMKRLWWYPLWIEIDEGSLQKNWDKN